MSQLYFVLTRRCNQYCASCPRHQENRIADQKYENVAGRLLGTVDKFGVSDVILSGGEPTLYERFPALLKELDERSVPVLIQTNGQRFSVRAFAEECFASLSKERIHILTAVHSMDPLIHDHITGVKGSFEKTVEGIHCLLDLGIRVSVKHIASALNYKGIPEYAAWISREFGGQAGLCISGMDYIGMTREEKAEYVLDYRDLAPQLERAADFLEEGRLDLPEFVVIELPLCMTDVKYRKYFLNTRTHDQIYQDAFMNYPARRIHDFTTDHPECSACRVREQCPGIWGEQYKTFKNCIRPVTGPEAHAL